MATLYEELVSAIDGVSGGPYPGRRAAHAKGILCEGSFTATPRAAELSRAGHLQGETVPATVRFSNGSGDPGLPDNARLDGRGLAVKLDLGDGRAVDSVTLTIPVFFVRTPEDFLEFTRARKPDPETGQPETEKLEAMLAEHPETAAAIQLILPSFVPPASYATCAFNSLHAFYLIDADEGGTWVRLRWEPEAGEESLAEEEIDGAGEHYLQEEIAVARRARASRARHARDHRARRRREPVEPDRLRSEQPRRRDRPLLGPHPPSPLARLLGLDRTADVRRVGAAPRERPPPCRTQKKLPGGQTRPPSRM
ncbi:MAG: catalase [Solirubrobacterales bacterium]